MKKFFKVVLVLVIAVFMYGCNKNIDIQGSKSININESHTYKVVSVSTEDLDLDSYKWEVDSKNKDFTLTNDESSEVVFNAQSVGTYTLKVRAKDGGKTFNAKVVIEVSEPEIINGHILPSEPDKVINDSTLLGVDVNNNGVRDDVERWIYKTYKDKHPVHIDIAMQAGRAYKKVLESPEKALEIMEYVDAPSNCEAYYSTYAKYFDKPLLIHENIDSRYFRHKIYFNTQERMNTYLTYDKLFSGGVYDLPEMEELKVKCDFNTSKYED